MRINRLAAAALLGITALGLGGCVTGFPAQVSRYQAMPAPQGQSFFVVPVNPRDNGSLEFQRYATLVAQAMQAQGYAAAASPQAASMLVAVNYGVDRGQREVVNDAFGGFYGGFGGFYDPFFRRGYYGRPYYSRFGYYGARSPFFFGWDDPFWGSPFDSPYGYDSYTVYKSFLDVNIRRRSDNASLFEGHARARSQTDNLGTLVPNLVEAMFTGFPGQNGETVKITVPPARRAGP
jgi:hypothetical protein